MILIIKKSKIINILSNITKKNKKKSFNITHKKLFIFTLLNNDEYEYKFKNGLGKLIHREAMKGIVPDFLLSNPIKFGFDSPLLHLFSETDPNSAALVLLSEKCLNRGLFSENAIRQAINKQKTGNGNYSRYLYRMLSVELWFREFID